MTSESENWWLHYAPGGVELENRVSTSSGEGRPHALSTAGRRRLFLTYVSPIHYNTMVPAEASEEVEGAEGTKSGDAAAKGELEL